VSETPSVEDAQLVGLLRAGDEAAFTALVRQLHRSLMKLAGAFVGSPAAAEEVVQEAWLAVVARIDAFEGRSSLRTWIGTIVVNQAKSRGVRDKRTVPWSSVAEGDAELEPAERYSARGFWRAPPTPWERGAEALLLRKEACLAIEEALELLPAAQRAVVTLRDIEGWSSEEVCNVLEVAETHQRVLLHRGRVRLRAALERYHSGRARRC
jgi:RNA polymerase sigma-70 factor, ECF subfamily